jgi:hypothetical protein
LVIDKGIGTDIGGVAAFVEDLSEDLVTEVFFAGASQDRLNFAGGCLRVKLLSVLSLTGRFVFVSFKLVETEKVKATGGLEDGRVG